MQQALDLWEGGIRATGGAIVPEKSHWDLIDFKWQRGSAGRYVTELSAGTTQGPPVRRQRSRPLRDYRHSVARRTLRSQTGTDGRSVRVMAEPTSLLQPVQGAELCNC
jgi:hypothetical protein